MRPRLRHTWAAWRTRALLLVEAVIITASTPRPREKVCAAASTSSPVPELTTHSAPNCRARLKRFASTSTPSTRLPCAGRRCGRESFESGAAIRRRVGGQLGDGRGCAGCSANLLARARRGRGDYHRLDQEQRAGAPG